MAALRSRSSSARRRQRSVRVTVAVALLGVATVAVLLALPTQSPALLSVGSVLAVLLGWAAVRIVWTEVLQSRRENATDRAAAANAYRSLFSERAAEHAEFTTAMTERLAASNVSVRELQGALVQAQRIGAEEKVRARTAEHALSQAQSRITELEASIELLRAENDELAGASGEVEDLVAFDERVAQAVKEATQDKQTKLA